MQEAHLKDLVHTKNILYVGDRVLYKEAVTEVRSITIIENSCLDGVDVPAIPWVAERFFTVTLSNNHWAYGEQIKPEV